MWIGIVLHATVILVVAFFVLFAAGKSEGLLKLFGTVLGLWIFVVAILAIAGPLSAPMFGGKPFGMDWHGMHDHWMHHDGGPGMAPPGGAPTEPAPLPGSHH
jgi:hypothetical protein